MTNRYQDFYVKLDLPCSAFHDDVGYHFARSKGIYEKITPDENIRTLDANIVRSCIGMGASNYLIGPGIEMAKYSFPVGPQLEFARSATNTPTFYRPISGGTTIQLHCVFLNKNGEAVPGWMFDARKQKYIVFACHFMSPDMKILANFEDFIDLIGLNGWTYKSNNAAHVSSKSKAFVPNMLSQGCRYIKMALQSSNISSVANICYSANDHVLPLLGNTMCMSEDGSKFFGIIPHVVPSASFEMYPFVYAALNEPGMTSTIGPCELYAVHFQHPSEVPVILFNKDIIFEEDMMNRLAETACKNPGTYTSDVLNFSNGEFHKLASSKDKQTNALFRMRDQRITIDSHEHHVSVQGLNIALVDVPLVYRVLQLYVVNQCGLDATRMSFLDPDDHDAMLAHKVNDWLEVHNILTDPSLQHVCDSLTKAVVSAFDDPLLFNSLMNQMEQFNPKRVDKTGIYQAIKTTLSDELSSITLALMVNIDLKKDSIVKTTTGLMESITMELPLLISFHN